MKPTTPARAAPLPSQAYRVLADHAPVGMLIVSRRRIRYANAALAHLLGYSIDELCAGMQPMALTAQGSRQALIDRARRGPSAQPHDVQCLRKDGSTFPARIRICRTEFEGEVAELATVEDLSETSRAMQVARRRGELLAQTEQLASIGACEYDIASGQVQQSAGMFRLFGEPIRDEAVSGEWLMDRLPPAEGEFVRSLLREARPGIPCEFEHHIVRADGVLRTVLHRSMVELDSQGRSTRIVSLLQDITTQRATERQRDLLAHTDGVTGLHNRHSLVDHLGKSLLQARRSDRSLALLVVQINEFKLVSDSLGLAGGDQLLIAVGERMRGVLGPTDTLAHLGHGRFALLPKRCEDADEATALGVAHAVVAALASGFLIAETEVCVTCAIGVSLYPRDGDDAQSLLNQAQAAVQQAGEQGDNPICLYAPGAHAEAARRLGMLAGLRHALQRGELSLHYQPQLDLSRGRMVGVEALLRWTDSAGRHISPAEFVPLAEETGLILPIGEWVLRTACAQNVAWQRAGLPPVRMAVNLSMRQLQQPDIASRLLAVLQQTGMDPHHLGIEITENVLMEESSHVAEVLHTLRGLGVEISLDDFGTGYSNLSYLSRLPIDVVKVDRSFVHDIAAPAHDVSMTRAVITMAHSLHMKVLAEGVESEGQVALLIAHHCDQMQGYYFSRPVPAEVVANMLRADRGLPERLCDGRRTLLLVDDDEALLDALRHSLLHDGYVVICARSGDEALRRLGESPVDVIVSDQRMPGMSGVEFLHRARDLYPDTVRILLSGASDVGTLSGAVNQGAIYKFLNKPVSGVALRAQIADAFRSKATLDGHRRLEDAVLLANQQLRAANLRLQQMLCARCDQQGRCDVPEDLRGDASRCAGCPPPVTAAPAGAALGATPSAAATPATPAADAAMSPA